MNLEKALEHFSKGKYWKNTEVVEYEANNNETALTLKHPSCLKFVTATYPQDPNEAYGGMLYDRKNKEYTIVLAGMDVESSETVLTRIRIPRETKKIRENWIWVM